MVALQRAAFGGILVVYLALAAAYARLTPAWNNPDEPAHYIYVAHIAETGTLPVLAHGDWDPDRLEPLIKSHFPPGSAIDFLRYESWQPPLYYLLAAPVYGLAPDNPPFARLQALHVFNILLGAATLGLTYLVARDVFDCPWLGLATAGVLLGVPMFAATSAAINNDNLANVIGAALTLLLVRLVGSPRAGYGSALGVGVVIGLGVLTKLTVGYFLPLALLTVGVRARRSGDGLSRAARESLVLLAGLMLVMSPWLVRQGLTYGWDDLLAKHRHDEVLIGRAFPSFEPSYLEAWGDRLFRSAWALFGWMQIPTSEKLYQLWSAVCQVALVGVAVELVARPRGRTLLLLGVAGGALATIFYYNVTTDVQPQGRFLFVALAAMVSLVALGWSALLPPRARLPAVCALDATLLAFNIYTLIAYLRPAF